jgi:pre-mRNA-splicing factor 18
LKRINKAEIERKRKLQEEAKGKLEKKYIKLGEIEQLREQEYLKRQQEKAKVLEPIKSNVVEKARIKEEMLALDPAQITLRLRKKGLPVRLFGETEDDRLARLKMADSTEERSNATPFASFVEEANKGLAEELVQDKARKEESKYAVEINEISAIDTTGISMELLKNDPAFCYSLVSTYFKKVKFEWTRTLQNRSDEDKQTREGKLESILHAQTMEHLKALFKRLKKNDLDEDVMERLVDICYFMQLREYVKANDAYMRLSIGNAAWPVGVVNVGIKE